MLTPFIKHFPPSKVEQLDIIKIQSNIEDVLVKITDKPFNDHVIIKDLVFEANVTLLIEHKLNRAYEGWVVVDKDKNANIWRDTTSTADTTKFIALKSGGTPTASILIY